jgi:hypothetical protein
MKRLIVITGFIFLTVIYAKSQVFVDLNAQGANNGTSWNDAYKTLDSAIINTETGEIWVAAGTYRPSIEINTVFKAYKAFQINKKISLYGGFSGVESNFNQRDISNNRTILSGDIGTIGNDLDNTPRVVIITGDNIDTTTVIDGFTIEKAYYTNGYDYENGAIYIVCKGNPIIRNCTIKENFGFEGSGIYVRNCSPLIINNTITENIAYEGAGIYLANYLANARIINNRITYNKCIGGYSRLAGGGIKIEAYSSPYIFGNLIDNNYAGKYGGGIANESNYSAIILNNIISNNVSGEEGGGIYIDFSPTQITNNLIINNRSTYGGGIFVDYSPNTNSINNTIVNNSSISGGNQVFVSAANMNFINTIVYNNPSQISEPIKINIERKDWFPKFKFCNIDGGKDGINLSDITYLDSIWKEGNLSIYPELVDTVNDNFQLKIHSNCINSGINDTTGLHLPEKDLLGSNRILYNRIDIGCYEFDSLIYNPTYVNNILENDITIYPNPVSDNLTILCPDCFLDADIKIYSINGKLLYAGKIYENYKIIEIKQYNVGMYILKVESPGGCIIRKIIKQ